METVKGSGRDQKTIKKVIPFTTGYHTLPNGGGMLDQPWRMMHFFDLFLQSEREATYQSLSK